MGTLSIIEPRPLSKTLSELGAIVKRPKVKILVLECPPYQATKDAPKELLKTKSYELREPVKNRMSINKFC